MIFSMLLCVVEETDEICSQVSFSFREITFLLFISFQFSFRNNFQVLFQISPKFSLKMSSSSTKEPLSWEVFLRWTRHIRSWGTSIKGLKLEKIFTLCFRVSVEDLFWCERAKHEHQWCNITIRELTPSNAVFTLKCLIKWKFMKIHTLTLLVKNVLLAGTLCWSFKSRGHYFAWSVADNGDDQTLRCSLTNKKDVLQSVFADTGIPVEKRPE